MKNEKNYSKQTAQCLAMMDHYPHPQDIPNPQEMLSLFREVVTFHNAAYHHHQSPHITDYEYDKLFSYLLGLEQCFPDDSRDSPTTSLADQYQENQVFLSADHPITLLSLANTYNAEDIMDFCQRVEKNAKELDYRDELLYNIEPKFDGLAASFVYVNGRLDRVITRGDGVRGDDITRNAKTIQSLPHSLDTATYSQVLQTTLVLRGEILMHHDRFLALNQERSSQGLPIFANARNAAAGTIKLLDSSTVAQRGLNCVIYDILDDGGSGLLDQCQGSDDVYRVCESLGLPILSGRSCGVYRADQLPDQCTNGERFTALAAFPFDFDGLVIKVGSMDLRRTLGATSHHPKRAIAFKFPAQQARAVIHTVIWSMGRTGVLTPVAQIDPVVLSGVTIRQASLHNMVQIHEKDIRLGDTVWIQRSGEVIPYILGPIVDARTGTEQVIIHPDACPFCETTLLFDPPFVSCPNTDCQGRLPHQIAHFVSKDCLDIEGMGPAIITILCEQGLLRQSVDIFSLADHQSILLRLPGFGIRKVSTIIDTIEKAKTQRPLWRWLHSFGIPGIGKNMAKIVADDIERADIQDWAGVWGWLSEPFHLAAVDGIGDVGVREIPLRAVTMQKLCGELEHYGCVWLAKKPSDQEIHGVICITGTFAVPRPLLAEYFESLGYRVDTGVTNQTTMLLAGENAGSKKKKAEGKGIQIIDRESMHELFPELQGYIDRHASGKDEQGLFG